MSVTTVSGRTRWVGCVADPIGHLRTPQAFNALMQQRGHDATMLPLHVPAAALGSFVAGIRTVRNLLGLVVTIPHKEAILAHCTDLTPAAQSARAANVIRFERDGAAIIGTNTDGAGFVAGLDSHGVPVRGQAVYLAGAGGAAKAIADAVLAAGARALGIYNRTGSRAAELVAQLRTAYPTADVHVADDAPGDYGVAVNATSLGLNEADPLPFRLERLDRGAIVAEVVMKQDVTPLLAEAQRRGHRIHLGRYMLDGQMDRIAEFLGLVGAA